MQTAGWSNLPQAARAHLDAADRSFWMRNPLLDPQVEVRHRPTPSLPAGLTWLACPSQLEQRCLGCVAGFENGSGTEILHSSTRKPENS